MKARLIAKSAVALRQHICPACRWRDAGDPSATVAWGCEARGAMFVHLANLTRLMEMFESEPPSGYDGLVENYLRFAHERSPAPKDEVEAPLRAYAADALSVIEEVVGSSDREPASGE